MREAPAEELPWEDGSFDAALAQLVVVFLNDAPRAARELARVTRTGGVVATCMWEVDGVEMMKALNEIRRRLSPGGPIPRPTTATRHRCGACSRRRASATSRRHESKSRSSTRPSTSCGSPRSTSAGRAVRAVDAFSPEQLAAGRAIFEEALGSPTGRYSLKGRAAAVRGVTG